jgi:hypothetical protein
MLLGKGVSLRVACVFCCIATSLGIGKIPRGSSLLVDLRGDDSYIFIYTQKLKFGVAIIEIRLCRMSFPVRDSRTLMNRPVRHCTVGDELSPSFRRRLNP